MAADLVYPVPVWITFVAFALLSLLACELCFRIGEPLPAPSFLRV